MKIEQHDRTLKVTMGSELSSVDELLGTVKTFMKDHCVHDQSPVKVVLRELLINAVEHGNKKITDKTVSCEIELIDIKRFKIIVRDEGQGFDHEKLTMDASEDPRKERHRGYVLINSLADEIRFNDSGNEVTVFLGTPEKTCYNVITAADGGNIVTPTGDITASTADDLRSVLLGLTNNGATHFIFDFQSVEDVDSVGLSVLVALSNSISETEGKVEIFNISEECKSLLRILHLDTVFDLKSDEHEQHN